MAGATASEKGTSLGSGLFWVRETKDVRQNIAFIEKELEEYLQETRRSVGIPTLQYVNVAGIEVKEPRIYRSTSILLS